MSITYRIYKHEPNMTPEKLEARCQSLGITTPHDANFSKDTWQGTMGVQKEAEKLDNCSEYVTLTIRRSAIESLLGYADASDDLEFTNTIRLLQELYTK